MTSTWSHSAAAEPALPDGRSELRRGALTMVPVLVGYLPFALLIGVAAASSSAPVAAWAGSLLIFAGSAHLAVIQSVDAGSAAWTVVATGLLINLRLMVYSTSLAKVWRGAPLWQRVLAAAAVIEPTWMLATRREDDRGSLVQRRAYFAGAAVILAVGWSTTMALGTVVGSSPALVEALAICTPACLTAIVVPHLRVPGGLRCLVAAAVVAMATSSWPAGSGLIAAMAAGAIAGMWPLRARNAGDPA